MAQADKKNTTQSRQKNESSSVIKPPKEDVIPLVALRDGAVFPHTESVLVFGRESSKLAIASTEKSHKYVMVVAQKDPQADNPTANQLYQIGTVAKIERTLVHEGDIHVLLRGLHRARITRFVKRKPFFQVQATKLMQEINENDEFEAKLNYLVSLFKKTIQAGKSVEFFNFIRLASGVKSQEIIDHVASTLDLSTQDKQELLEELNVNSRLDKVIEYLSHEQHILSIEQSITKETKKKLDERMRESILRERMNVIQQELGESEEDEIKEFEKKLLQANPPAKVAQKIQKEINRLSQLSPMHAEYSYLSTWLETVLELPWSKTSKERTSLKRAQRILDQDHYGLDKVKERILEHLAVMQLHEKQQTKTKTKKSKKSHDHSERLSTILCFVGPPGVGKTSIGRSIAEALNRQFVKVSLGGVRDESEIRGHRRTYVGAMPGRILQGIEQAGTKNPVMMLDEIDKLGADFRGDPSAALLEVLDPEQNHEFTDHYVGEPFDLSEVIFITTANVLHTIPDPLRDRLEIVEYPGYTLDEKFQIAKQYLMNQVINGSGLKKNQFSITDGALKEIIERYTREAGVRQLKRELSKLARKAARKIAEKETEQVKVTKRGIDEYLGPPKFLETITEKDDQVGLVNGLAWTRTGGEILPIETSLTPGKEGITLTGQLGKVMQESAKAALTYVRSRAKQLKLDEKKLNEEHVHVHVPEGAVPKDGPSAGIAITTALASAYTGKKVRSGVAMTGEVTLRGRVLAIGGLKEKLIAAHRAGIKTAIIPKQNEKDLVEIPAKVKKDLTIKSAEHMDEVLKIALID